MTGENSNAAVLEQRLAVPNAFKDGFVDGMNYASPLGLLDEPLPVMLVDRAKHRDGWFAGGAVGLAADGVLLYGAVEIVSKIIDYI